MKSRLVGLFAAVLLLTSLVVAGSAQQGTVHRKTPSVQVDLYVTSWCPYCKKAQSFLDREGVAYRLYDVERDADAARRKQQLAPGRGVPFAIINGIPVSGWSEQAYRAALRN